MSANIWDPSGEILAASEGSVITQHFSVSDTAQDVFTLTAFSYVPDTNSVTVYINGVFQRSGIDYEESSGSTITFISHDFVVGDTVSIIGIVDSSIVSGTAGGTTFTPAGSISSTNVQDAIVEATADATEQYERTLHRAFADDVVDLTIPNVADRALKFLGFDASGVPVALPGTGEASWGAITGTLSAQIDLQTALNLKADASAVPAQFAPVAGTNITLSGTYPNITFNASGAGSPSWGSITGTLSAQTDLQSALNAKLDDTDVGSVVQAYHSNLTSWSSVTPGSKQDALVSGTNIKTINSNSLLGSGDLVISAGTASILRSARTSDTILASGDAGKLIDITSGTFTQTLTAAATLGSGWFCYIKNSGTGTITLDPSGAETVDGLGGIYIYPGESFLLECNGTSFFTAGRQKVVTILPVTTISAGTASVSITQPFTDTEIGEFEVFFSELGLSGNSVLNLSLSPSTSMRHTYVGYAAAVEGNAFTTANPAAISSSSATHGLHLKVINPSVPGIIQIHAMGRWASTGMRWNNIASSAAITTTGITIAPSGQTISSGSYSVLGYRK